RLARGVHAALPEDPEVAGLLSLMLLTDARRPARTRADGELVPLAEQDRDLWDRELITEGVALITDALRRGQVGAYEGQAAIAAVGFRAAAARTATLREQHYLTTQAARLATASVAALDHQIRDQPPPK